VRFHDTEEPPGGGLTEYDLVQLVDGCGAHVMVLSL